MLHLHEIEGKYDCHALFRWNYSGFQCSMSVLEGHSGRLHVPAICNAVAGTSKTGFSGCICPYISCECKFSVVCAVFPSLNVPSYFLSMSSVKWVLQGRGWPPFKMGIIVVELSSTTIDRGLMVVVITSSGHDALPIMKPIIACCFLLELSTIWVCTTAQFSFFSAISLRRGSDPRRKHTYDIQAYAHW